MRRINFMNDQVMCFDLKGLPGAENVDLGAPADFAGVIYVQGNFTDKKHRVEFSYTDGKARGCSVTGTEIAVAIERGRLLPGVAMFVIEFSVSDERFPTGRRRVTTEGCTGFEMVRGQGAETPADPETITVTLPYLKGEKGDKGEESGMHLQGVKFLRSEGVFEFEDKVSTQINVSYGRPESRLASGYPPFITINTINVDGSGAINQSYVICLYPVRVQINDRNYLDSKTIQYVSTPMSGDVEGCISVTGHKREREFVFDDFSIIEAEKSLVTTEQALTEAEQAQVLANLGNPQMRLFIDQWNTAWGSYGKYDPANAPDPQHPFMGNDIWMTFNEAFDAMAVSDGEHFLNGNLNCRFMSWNNSGTIKVRTMPPLRIYENTSVANLFWGQNEMEAIRILGIPTLDNIVQINSSMLNIFNKCNKLRKVYGTFAINARTEIFSQTEIPVELIQIDRLKQDINLGCMPNLSLYSVNFIVSHAINNTAITITVHKDVYAKLTDESNTEWYQVLTDAQAKNINFATV